MDQFLRGARVRGGFFPAPGFSMNASTGHDQRV